MVRVGILTSSRADFGVYLPLLRKLKSDDEFELSIIAFGTHLSPIHGTTIEEIRSSGFQVAFQVSTAMGADDAESISTSVGVAIIKFSSFWSTHKHLFDVVLCLGDRYEMCAAVLSGIPHGIKFGHLYGGDQSLGAIDDVYRDCMTKASKVHFTSTQKCAQRVKQLTLSEKNNVHVVGILSLENIKSIALLSREEVRSEFKIDFSAPTVLMTFHPETVHAEMNEKRVEVVREVIEFLVAQFQLVITMPNADTNASVYRNLYSRLQSNYSDRIFLFENLGVRAYFSCMQHSLFMIGNTSSGISEAPSFNKYFINVGDRQKGRETGKNVISVPFDLTAIKSATAGVLNNPVFNGDNIYYQEAGIERIVNALKRPDRE
jgi:GDP/UDP-N,N'-diacetylbacillosamine 2-epimerase (hydrolysing)